MSEQDNAKKPGLIETDVSGLAFLRWHNKAPSVFTDQATFDKEFAAWQAAAPKYAHEQGETNGECAGVAADQRRDPPPAC
jgi:hypothetical protein